VAWTLENTKPTPGNPAPLAKLLAQNDLTASVQGLRSGQVTVTGTIKGAEPQQYLVTFTLAGTTITGIVVDCKVTVLQLGGTKQCEADGTYMNGGVTDTEPVPAANFKWTEIPQPSPLSVSQTGMVTGVSSTAAGGPAVSVTGVYDAGNSATPVVDLKPVPSAGIKVVTAPSAGPLAQFGAAPVAGTSVVTVVPQTSGDTISIWAFLVGSGFTGSCDVESMKYGRPLQIISTTGTGSSAVTTTTTGFQINSNGATPLTINELLVPGELLCLVETPPGSASMASWSNQEALAVVDPNDFGRVRPYFVLGMQATNQQTASGNSSVAQYLEVGFNFTNARARDHWIGLGSNLDLRLSPIPVAGSVSNSTGTATGTVSTLTVSSITPNQLSSQQSVRGVVSLYAPLKVMSWNKKLDYFTVAPLGRAGVGTLLNSSTSSSSGGSASGSPTQIATTSFAPGLYFWGAGARIAWDRMVKDTDKAPQTITQFLMTVGEYSNLPSYVCKPLPSGTSNPYGGATTITTACSQLTSGSTYYGYFRTVRPRLDVEGLAKLPGYPFVLGLDANLQQYAVWTKLKMDYLNKPGNDVRIWVGISVDIRTLISKL
jgi:hypothetical protein